MNDAWTWGDPILDREHPKWGKKPPDSFEAALTVSLDDEMFKQIQEHVKTKQKVSPPEKLKLAFFTQMDGIMPITWGDSVGGTGWTNQESSLEFYVPWQDLLAGKPVTIKLPYEAGYPEDKGTWTIVFQPKQRR